MIPWVGPSFAAYPAISLFNRKAKSTIDSLIGLSTSIEGDVRFKGGLRIDGHVKGNVIAEAGQVSVLVIAFVIVSYAVSRVILKERAAHAVKESHK